MSEFDAKTAEAIGHYVYCLVDPRNEKPFYIGKGTGNRVFSHANDHLKRPEPTDKLETIREIHKAQLQVGHVIVRHGLTAETALAVESALIDFALHFDLGLTNLALGHQSAAFGIMTVEEVSRIYAAEPLKELGDDCIVININRTYKRAKGGKSIYEATKESWVINEKRLPNIRYVLAEYNGYIVEVFEVEPSSWYRVRDHNEKLRWGFHGRHAPDEVRKKYLNRSVVKRRGAANPISFKLQSLADHQVGPAAGARPGLNSVQVDAQQKR